MKWLLPKVSELMEAVQKLFPGPAQWGVGAGSHWLVRANHQHFPTLCSVTFVGGLTLAMVGEFIP